MTTSWKIGDDPKTHPMWDEQVRLEYEMLVAGREAFKDAVESAKRKGKMTALNAIERIAVSAVEPCTEYLKAWIKAWSAQGKRGVRPQALKAFDMIPVLDAVLIALRTVMDQAASKEASLGLARVAMEIGSTIAHEINVRKWASSEPGAFRLTQRRLDEQGATAEHRRKVNIAFVNNLLEANPELEEVASWENSMKLAVGITLIDTIKRVTGWIEIVGADGPRAKKIHRAMQTLRLTEPAQKQLSEALEHAEMTRPVLAPCIMPPKRWTSMRDGGYYTPIVKHPTLVRFKAHQKDQRDWAFEDYAALDMPVVYECIHALQETPWRINKRVLEVMKAAWALDKGIGKLPIVTRADVPPPPADIKDNPEAPHVKQWRQDAARIYGDNAKRWGRSRDISKIVQLAESYQEYPEIYFPHMMDFRGRKYPMTIGLHPQGHDIARGLLEFGTGKPLGEEGFWWLTVHLANVAGYDKATFEERIAWTIERRPMWESIASDPMNDLRWAKMDKPWVTLATCIAWVEATKCEHEADYVCRIPVHVDGTCNGIQHLSALTRDLEGGRLVNLVPSPAQTDIYKVVAQRVQATCEEVEQAGGPNAGYAAQWLDVTGRDFPRSLAKRQVMVLPYGGSKDAFYKYTAKWLEDQIAEHKVPLKPWSLLKRNTSEHSERAKLVGFMSTLLWAEVHQSVSGAMGVMKWLQDVAKKTTKGNQPIYWKVPSGFVVRHFYGVFKLVEVKVRTDGETYRVRILDPTSDLAISEQLKGIPPNFVHSLDAAALDLCVHIAKQRGLRDFTAIHDAYGTHAGDMTLLSAALREGFVLVHKECALNAFRDGCQRVVRDYIAATEGTDIHDADERADRELPKVPPMGALDISAVSSSDYFFA